MTSATADPEIGGLEAAPRHAGTRVLTLLEAVREALREEMARDPRVVLLGEDIGRLGGVFRATEGLLEAFGPERVVETPMMELGIAGLAVGMAMKGLRPVAEIQFADFMHAAADHIISDAARLRFRSNGDWTCPLVVRTAYGGGLRGGPYHSQSVEALYAHVPGLKVAIPSFPADVKGLLTAAIRDPDPVLFLEHKKTYRAVRGEVPAGEHTLPFGQARVVRPGDHVTVVGWGWVLHEALAAAEGLASEGIAVEVIDPRTLVPFDREAVLASVARTGRLCVVHEDTRTMGFGAEIAALVAETAPGDLRAPVRRVTMPDVAGLPANAPMEDALIPDRQRIATALRELARVDRAPRAIVANATPASAPRQNGAAGPAADDTWADVVTRSATTVPQAASVVEVDLSSVVQAMERARDTWQTRGLHPHHLYAGFFARALAVGVQEAPRVNAAYDEAAGVIRRFHALSLGLSVRGADARVAARHALVPDADTRTVLGLAIEAQRTEDAGAEEPGLLASATVTLADYGPGSALLGVPLVLPGQAVAVRVGAIEERLVTRGRGFSVVPSVYLCASVDHRALDGTDAGALLGAMKRFLETYDSDAGV